VVSNCCAVFVPVLIVGPLVSAEGFPQTQAQALLELFKVARDEGDVEDARAWFNELSKENPTVVRPSIPMKGLELTFLVRPVPCSP
jgi:hypothetical protein